MKVTALVLSVVLLALLHCEVHGQCGSWVQQFYTVNEGEITGSVTLTAQFTTATSQQQLHYATRDDTATAQRNLQYLERTNSSLTLRRCDDCASPAITVGDNLVPFGDLNHSVAHISSNGIISFGSEFTNFAATPFPTDANNPTVFNSYVAAPYWSDIDGRTFGEVWYETHMAGQGAISNSLLDRVSNVVRSEEDHPSFQGTWMVVATWNGSVQFGGSGALRNTFQGIVITDGSKTYAVYIYRCNDIQWSDGSVIGFNAGGSYFANHPLSDSIAARDIDCVNSPGSEWNNVVYDLNPNVSTPATNTSTNTVTGDYLGDSGTLTFDAENTTQDVVVLLRNDQVFEPTETFFVDLMQLGGTLCDTATVFIQDDDQPQTTLVGTQEATCPTSAQRELALRVVTASFNDFTIITNNIGPTEEIVDHPCGPGFWTQVALLNLTDPSQQCPPAWIETITAIGRGCTRPESPSGSCLSTTYSSLGVEYNQVCGRIIGIQDTTTDAFINFFANTIDGPYVDGVSLTHGMPRQHIWSFASGLQESVQSGTNGCFCGDSAITPGAPPPAFVGTNYFCESGNSEQSRPNIVYTEDPLWDGLDCPTNNCCEFNTPPWFNAELPAPTTDDIEVRLCCDQDTTDENIIVQFLELYVSHQTTPSQTSGVIP